MWGHRCRGRQDGLGSLVRREVGMQPVLTNGESRDDSAAAARRSCSRWALQRQSGLMNSVGLSAGSGDVDEGRKILDITLTGMSSQLEKGGKKKILDTISSRTKTALGVKK